jgi:hypothetical protein
MSFVVSESGRGGGDRTQHPAMISAHCTQVLSVKDLTIYKIIYSAVNEKPEGVDKSLKRMVGASGFEPPTS